MDGLIFNKIHTRIMYNSLFLTIVTFHNFLSLRCTKGTGIRINWAYQMIVRKFIIVPDHLPEAVKNQMLYRCTEMQRQGAVKMAKRE